MCKTRAISLWHVCLKRSEGSRVGCIKKEGGKRRWGGGRGAGMRMKMGGALWDCRWSAPCQLLSNVWLVYTVHLQPHILGAAFLLTYSSPDSSLICLFRCVFHSETWLSSFILKFHSPSSSLSPSLHPSLSFPLHLFHSHPAIFFWSNYHL